MEHDGRRRGSAQLDAGEGSAAIADCVTQAERLARTPDADRDLAWHVAAAYVGDITALVTARLRAADTPVGRG